MAESVGCVIMAVWRGDSSEHLAQAVDSLRAASSVGRVYIGADGPLTPPLAELLASLASEGKRWSVHRFSRQRGLGPLLNDLIRLAVADPAVELVFRMDPDDRCHPQRFLRQTAFMWANPSIAVSGCWARVIDGQGNSTGLIRKPGDDRVLKLRLPLNSPFAHPTVVFRAEVLRGGLRYPEDAPLFEDVAFWARLARANCCFSNLQEVLYDYRYTSATAQRRVGIAKAWPELRVRLTYIRRQLPWRLDLVLASLVIFALKTLLPAPAFSRLLALRTRLIDGLDRLHFREVAEGGGDE